MADEPRNKAELLARIESSRRALLARLGAETEVALVVAGPDGGWSVKDHIAHIAAWERYLAALLTGVDRWTEMGLTAAPSPPDETAINEAIYERNKDLSLRQVYAGWDAAHQMVLRAVEAMSEEDLMQPFSHFVPGATGEGVADPIVGWINGNTWGHYEEHAAWIEDDLARSAAAQDDKDEPQTVAGVIEANQAARAELLALIAGLDDAALSAPRGPGGWAIKDHLIHLAAWERGVAAMLGKRDRWNAMGLTDEQAGSRRTPTTSTLLFEASKGRLRRRRWPIRGGASLIDALATSPTPTCNGRMITIPGGRPTAGPPIIDISAGMRKYYASTPVDLRGAGRVNRPCDER
jgi:uncharacterized damage-inducible protein DinB